MKLLFINCAYPKEIENELREHSSAGWQMAANVFQWAVIEGLEQSGVNYTLVCTPSLAAWPRYKHLFTPEGEMTVDGKPRGHYLSYCDAPVLKQLSQRRVLRNYVKRWCEANNSEDRFAVLSYTQQAELLGAAIDLKKNFPNLVVAPIVTDLIENALDFASNRTFLKRLQVKMEAQVEHKLLAKVDKFVLLTSQMTEFIPEAKEKYIVVEGIAPKIEREALLVAKTKQPRSLLYTGVLEEYAGVRMLVDAFMDIKMKNVRLIICGGGSDENYIRNAMALDSRISFRGRVDREEAVKLQRECTLLINPRQPNGSITKYSFPSKTMEYMTSGTPMIGYRLEGIPEEYYPYMFTPIDFSIQALSQCIDYCLNLPQTELDSRAEAAFNFIMQQKNPKIQIMKILDFLQK